MSVVQEEVRGTRKLMPLRVWPAIVILLLMAALKSASFFLPLETAAVMITVILGPVLLGAMVILWWVTFSRASVKERLLGLGGVVLSAAAAHFLVDATMQGPGQIMIGFPLGTFAFGLVAILLRNVLSTNRALCAVIACLLGFASIGLFRSDGMWGDGRLGLDWRWNASPEEKMLSANAADAEPAVAVEDDQLEDWLLAPQWPQFRGPQSDGRFTGPEIFTDWSDQSPKLLWKIDVGPGWSSFAVAGNLLFTQQQLGEHETVVCYAADSGKKIWKQQINQRFFEPLGGPGPRATPTVAGGMLFAQSAMGELQRLDPKTGAVVWAKDLKAVAARQPPHWGFSSSPLVVEDIVIAYAGGKDDKGLLGFDVESGALVWSAKAGDHAYSSPQAATLLQRDCVLMTTNEGLHVVDPKTGAVMLDYQWLHSGYRATQAAVMPDSSIIISTQELGTRRIGITPTDDGNSFTATDIWSTRQPRPDFNDFVIHNDHAYGFDGAIFISVAMRSGKRNWKGGRYGKGQVLLLQNSALLLVAAEDGEIVLIKADPESRQEVAKFQALQGRTWNHPVVIGDRLYLRNSQEAACYILPTEKSAD